MQEKLEKAYKADRLLKVGNGPTTDSRKYDEYGEEILPIQHEQYEYEGKRYVRVKANSCYDGGEFTLSNGEKYKDGDNVWVEVQPVKWAIDEEEKIMIADKLIFSGVPFNHTRDYHTKDFDKTDIKIFMDRYLSRDLEQLISTINLKEQTEKTGNFKERKSRLQKLNPDKTKATDRVKMTDT